MLPYLTAFSTLFAIYIRLQFIYRKFDFYQTRYMNPTTAAITELFDRIPRRHTPDNVKDIYSILSAYEDILISIEAQNAFYEKNISIFFEQLDEIRSIIKKSSDNKASKKNKDSFFDEASGTLKDSMQALMALYADGNRTA